MIKGIKALQNILKIPTLPEPEDEYQRLKKTALEKVEEVANKVSKLEIGFFSEQIFSELFFTHTWEEMFPGIWGKELFIDTYSPHSATLLAIKADKGVCFPAHFHFEAEDIYMLQGSATVNLWEPINNINHIQTDVKKDTTVRTIDINLCKQLPSVVLKNGDSLSISKHQPHDITMHEKSYYLVHWTPPLSFIIDKNHPL